MTDDPQDKRLLEFNRNLTSIGVAELTIFKLKICLYAALVVGGPFLLWQMWQFIAAGLYKKERRSILKYFPLSVAAFVAGVLFGYFLMVPYAIYFLNKDIPIRMGTPQITVQHYLTFLSSLCVAFGLIFQLPLLMTALGAAGVVDARVLARHRGTFAIGGFVVAALLTPPDPFTQLMMAIPLLILYELGIWGARLGSKGTRTPAAEEAVV